MCVPFQSSQKRDWSHLEAVDKSSGILLFIDIFLKTRVPVLFGVVVWNHDEDFTRSLFLNYGGTHAWIQDGADICMCFQALWIQCLSAVRELEKRNPVLFLLQINVILSDSSHKIIINLCIKWIILSLHDIAYCLCFYFSTCVTSFEALLKEILLSTTVYFSALLSLEWQQFPNFFSFKPGPVSELMQGRKGSVQVLCLWF